MYTQYDQYVADINTVYTDHIFRIITYISMILLYMYTIHLY